MQPLNNWSLDILDDKSAEISNYVKKYHRINFIVLGDSHLICDRIEDNKYILDSNGEQYKRILNHILKNKKIKPMFIIHGGDTVNAGDNINSFAAFVDVTKNILKNVKLPIFTSIGNHDYDRNNISSTNFKSYIGSKRDIIKIPGAHLKYIYLSTHYSDAPINAYKSKFSEKDISLLLNESKLTNNNYYYIVDFHAPLNNSSSFLSFNDHELSYLETNKFLSSINGLNILGVFCHHKHISYKTKINVDSSNKSIRYVVSGCGGNHNNNENFSYYYVTIDTKNLKITNCKKYLVS